MGGRLQEKLKEVYAQLDSPVVPHMKNKQQDAPDDNDSKIVNLTTSVLKTEVVNPVKTRIRPSPGTHGMRGTLHQGLLTVYCPATFEIF